MAEDKINNAPSAQDGAQAGADLGVEIVDNATIEQFSKLIIEENLPAYKELAK